MLINEHWNVNTLIRTWIVWISGAVAQWRSGAVAQWRSGAVAQWRSGAVAQWRSGAVAQWRSGAAARATDSRLRESRTLPVHSALFQLIQLYQRIPNNDGYVCTNSLRALTTAWLDASQRN